MTASTRKTLEKRVNSRGDVFALVSDGQTFEVWRLSSNYDGRVRGGIRRSWRYVEKGMPEDKARSLFARRTA
jgi:hypothetical protein